MQTRYTKNVGSIVSPHLQEQLLNSVVAIVGVGGNGGYIAEYVARLGVGKMIIFDGDTFEESNLNRQTFSTEQVLGQKKAQVTLERLTAINSNIEYLIADCYLEERPDWLENEHPDFIFWCADGHGDRSRDDMWTARNAVKRCLMSGGCTVIESCLYEDEAFCAVFTGDDIDWYNERTDSWLRGQEIRKEETEWDSQPAYLCAMSAAMAVNEMVKTVAMENYPAFGQMLVYNLRESQTHRIDHRYGKLY